LIAESVGRRVIPIIAVSRVRVRLSRMLLSPVGVFNRRVDLFSDSLSSETTGYPSHGRTYDCA
jgi:hypothetical protein